MKLAHLDAVDLDSAYLRQQRDGFRWLRFQGGLELAFRRYHAQTYLRRMRWALLVAVLLVLLFAVLDLIALPEGVREPTLAIRLGLMLPLLLLAGWATFLPRLRPFLQLITGVCALGCGLVVAAIVWISRSQNFPLPYEGIILVTVFLYFLLGLRFATAVTCGWLVFLAYLLVELAAGLPARVLVYNAFFLAMTNLICSVGCYFLEYGARENFLAQGLLQDLVEKDFLTGLLNRRAFSEKAGRRWRQALREQQPLALVMMDVDFFKRYNDHYGHLAGDAVLRAIARVLAEHARRPLDCVARYGGEEFVGLWYGLDEARALAITESIRSEIQALDLPHAASGVAAVVTLSIGVAHVLPPTPPSLEDALRLADAALYLAKDSGRNQVAGRRAGQRIRAPLHSRRPSRYPAPMTTHRPLALIAALAANRVIGLDNRMPWHLPADLKHFKALTLGKPIIMGRKTWDSLGRPLPGRLNLVVSRQAGLQLEGAEVFADLATALARADQWAGEQGVDELMLIGGGQLYAQALPLAERLYLTRIDAEPAGDAFFPAFDEERWQRTERQAHPAQEATPGYAFETWLRR